jgi:hypothetical protein
VGEEKFYSQHLYYEQDRLARFRAARHRIEASKGDCTIRFEINQPPEELGAIDFWTPARGDLRNSARFDSEYLIMIGTQPYRLKFGNNRIGRLDDNDLIIDDIYVSRRHCCIVIHSDGRAELFDTASKNHIWVNGAQIDHCLLNSGDEIRLARSCHLTISLINSDTNPAL